MIRKLRFCLHLIFSHHYIIVTDYSEGIKMCKQHAKDFFEAVHPMCLETENLMKDFEKHAN